VTTTYPIAPNGIFYSLQGEAHLRGFPMTFVRLGGCSVGCPQCDTDYTVADKLTADEIVREAIKVRHPADRDSWVWITGGEPADHDLRPLLSKFKAVGFSTAVATSGSKRVIPPVDWLSVSPHSYWPDRFHQRYGNEVKLVDGLNGLDLEIWVAEWDDKIDFMYRYVQPLSRNKQEDPESLKRCIEFVKKNPRWALSRQDHHYWAMQ